MDGGKSVELLALEQCLPSIQDFLSGGAVDLRWFAGKLTEKGLIGRHAANAILNKRGTTDMEIACGLMNAVVAQVALDEEMYHRFCSILSSEEALSALNKKLKMAYESLTSSSTPDPPKKDVVKVTDQQLDTMITDEHINAVSLFLPRSEDLAILLGVDPLEIAAIKATPGITVFLQNHKVLSTWKAAKYRAATYKKLIKELENLKEVPSAAKVSELVS